MAKRMRSNAEEGDEIIHFRPDSRIDRWWWDGRATSEPTNLIHLEFSSRRTADYGISRVIVPPLSDKFWFSLMKRARFLTKEFSTPIFLFHWFPDFIYFDYCEITFGTVKIIGWKFDPIFRVDNYNLHQCFESAYIRENRNIIFRSNSNNIVSSINQKRFFSSIYFHSFDHKNCP